MVKVIEEPVNYESQIQFGSLLDTSRRFSSVTEDPNKLSPKFRAAQFSGPEQLRQLKEQCFEHFKQNYKWVICPFQNVTQFEQNLRWRPFKGVLGVWYEWQIKENRFEAMKMLNGDDCGSHGNRQTRVFLTCALNSEKSEIVEVKEPSTCNYEITFQTPLACDYSNDYGNYSLKVYPNLNKTLQFEWDLAKFEFDSQLITETVFILI